MNCQLARINARICGDGNISKYKTSESDRNMRAEVMYTNYDQKNIEEFREDLDSEFGVKGTVYENRVRVKSIKLVESLEAKFGEFSSENFSISDEIMEASEKVKLEWLRAFIRDEGYHDVTNNRLRIKLMNKGALRDIRHLMADVGVKAKITGPNCDGSWYLTVSSLDRYDDIYDMAENKAKVK